MLRKINIFFIKVVSEGKKIFCKVYKVKYFATTQKKKKPPLTHFSYNGREKMEVRC